MFKNIKFFVLIAFACLSCEFNQNSKSDPKHLVVSENNQVFSVDLLKVEPGKEVSFNLSNKLKNENLEFFLLKEGEDPILVQHIKAQQGHVPKEYVFFKSKEIAPKRKLQIIFKAPKEEGEYSYVGISNFPKEGLVGRLIVKKEIKTKKTTSL